MQRRVLLLKTRKQHTKLHNTISPTLPRTLRVTRRPGKVGAQHARRHPERQHEIVVVGELGQPDEWIAYRSRCLQQRTRAEIGKRGKEESDE